MKRAVATKDEKTLTRKDLTARHEGSKVEVFTGSDMLKSGIVGIWKHRADIKDSSKYAQDLRKKAETRKA